MLSSSAAFKAAVRENPVTLFKATLRYADGSTVQLTHADAMDGGQSYASGVSSDGSFDIGSAIIGKFSISLDNSDGRYDDAVFEGATIEPYVGKNLGTSTEWLRMGVYGIEQPNTYGTVISLSALDNMRKFERPYSDVSTTYPATLDTILRDICTKCGVTLATSAFPNRTYSVKTRPEGDLTCLQMVSYVAQLACCWAKCDNQGRLSLGFYDKSFATGEPEPGTYANLDSVDTMSVYTDDAVITGVRVTAQDEVASDGTKGEDGESYLYGAEGYVVDMPANPLVLYGQAKACATAMGQTAVGLRFRPFEAVAIGDPSIEAGDPVMLTDAKGVAYRTYATTITYKSSGYETFACRAEYPGRNSAAVNSALSQVIATATKAVEREKTAREQAILNLASQLATSSGLYMTAQRQQDGSSIYYMHDKPTLGESQIVWKLTANAFGISTDGGKTYAYGLDVNGDAILNRIYAIGIDASYIDTGRIAVTKNGKTVFMVDVDTGTFLLQDASGNNMWDSEKGFRLMASTQVGNTTLDAISKNAANANGDVSLLKVGTTKAVDLVYGVSDSKDKKPTSMDTDANKIWKKGKWLWVREKMTMYDGTPKYSEWRLLANGDGLGVRKVTEQYYLSTLKTGLRGGTWADSPQAYVNGRYYFTRNRIEWSDGTISYDYPNGRLVQSFTSVSEVYDTRLNQRAVFNKLTNNGAAKGLATDSKGNLYINASYINTGTITDLAGRNYWNLVTGDFQLSALSTLEKTVANTKVGGTNLVNGTEKFAGWWNTAKAWTIYTDDGYAHCPASVTSSIGSTIAGGTKYGDVRGREITVSLDIKGGTSWGAVSATNCVYVSVRLCDSSNKRQRWRAFRLSKNPTTSWQRVSFTFECKDDTFTGGTAKFNTSWLLGVEVFKAGTSRTLQVRKLKVEVGNVATDWSATAYDAQKDATEKAQKALTDGKTYTASQVKAAKADVYASTKGYTDSITAKDRAYTDKQKKDLSDSLNAQGIFNRLTNNGKVPGIYTGKDAKGNVTGYYINATYIQTGTLDAKVLKAGIIKQKASEKGAKFEINLDKGYLLATNAEFTNMKSTGGTIESVNGTTKLQIQGGQLRGYRGTSRVGFIDATARVSLLGGKTKKVMKVVDGLQIQSEGILRISTPRLGVMNSSDTTKNTTTGFTGSVKLNNVTFDMKANGSKTGSVELKFINGIFVGVGAWTSGLITKTKQEYEDN